MKSEPRWISAVHALAIHDEQISEHGGISGIRDAGLLESALARPRNQWSYGEENAAALAASYAFGLARNHPFLDGNKRTAWVLARLFLAMNGRRLQFDKPEAIDAMLKLAAGELAEPDFARWLQDRLA